MPDHILATDFKLFIAVAVSRCYYNMQNNFNNFTVSFIKSKNMKFLFSLTSNACNLRNAKS